MDQEATLRCASCRTKDCAGGKDCYGDADRHRALYDDPQVARLHKAASAIEARHYCKEPRIREVMLFAKEMGYRKLGLAFCIGLAPEAQTIADILAREFEVVSVCCKFCGIDKKPLGLEQIAPEKERETMCNPAGQATGAGLRHLRLYRLPPHRQPRRRPLQRLRKCTRAPKPLPRILCQCLPHHPLHSRR